MCCLFCTTVLFYTYAYIQEKNIAFAPPKNEMYIQQDPKTGIITNRILIKKSQYFLISLCTSHCSLFFSKILQQVSNYNTPTICSSCNYWFIALSYYGVTIGSFKINSRRTGWFKPFVWVCMGSRSNLYSIGLVPG